MLKEETFRAKGAAMELSLQKAIEIAMEKNPQMQVSQSSLRENMANLDLTQSNYRSKWTLTGQGKEYLSAKRDNLMRSNNTELFQLGPEYKQNFQNGSNLTVSPHYEYDRSALRGFNTSLTNPLGDRDDHKFNVDASYNFPLNSRPRQEIRTQLENAKLAGIQSDYNLYMRKKAISEQVIDNYWRIKQLQENVAIQNERLLQARRIEFIIQTQYQYDQASRVQVGQAQVDVLNNEASIISIEGGLRNSIETFNLILGLPVVTQLNLSDNLEVTPLPMSADAYIALITSSNLELKSFRISIQQTENTLKAARLGQQPDLIWSNSVYRDDMGVQDIVTALSFSWAFGDGGATRARVRALKEQLEQIRINLWDRERTLVQDTYSDLRALQLELQRMEILKRNVDQAYTNLDNALFNFQQFGRITLRDMQYFQIDLSTSRSSLAQSKVQYNISKSSLLQKVHDYEPSEVVKPLLNLLD